MSLDAIIVADTFDCRSHKRELVKQLLELKLKPQVVSVDYFAEYMRSTPPPQPVLFYSDPSTRIENPLEVLRHHRMNADSPAMAAQNGGIISINPSLVKVFPDNRISSGKPALTLNITASRQLPPVDPVSIISFSHNRDVYFQLTLNSLFNSLGDRIPEVSITLALSKPTLKVRNVALAAHEKHPSIRVLEFDQNTHLATPIFAIKSHPNIGKNIFILEDDFILPLHVKEDYPDWPWWFSHRLQYFDLVHWAQSIENMPNEIKSWLWAHNVELKREPTSPANKWINSFNNNHRMGIGGMGIGCSVEHYMTAVQRSDLGFSTDSELEVIAQSISIPRVFGYHIGWNQEQDGFPKLSNLNRWGKVPQQVEITNLITKEKSIQSI